MKVGGLIQVLAFQQDDALDDIMYTDVYQLLVFLTLHCVYLLELCILTKNPQNLHSSFTSVILSSHDPSCINSST